MRLNPAQMPKKPDERAPGATPALLMDDPRFDRHRPRAYHPERPERLVAARAAVERAPVRWGKVEPREAAPEDLVRVHDARFIDELLGLRGRSLNLDPDTYVSEASVEVALLAAGGVVALVDALLEGETSLGVALPRPPGHHARPSQAMGFCLLNNVAIAAAHARARGVARVAVVDFDVHHGNGTQEIFATDASVLYLSTHQFPFYPGTGALEEAGLGEGKGFTVNVPLTAGGGDAVYRAAFDRVVAPVLEAYAPDLLLVSAGFDAAARDPLAEMNVSAQGFGYMASVLARQARASAKGRMALVLEGGYDLGALEAGLLAAIRGAAGESFGGVESDPDEPDVVRAAMQAGRAWKI